MKSLRTIGLALSVIFGCLLFALFAELYYLLWWKKRITRRGIEDGPGKELFFFFFFCRKKPSSCSSSCLKPQDLQPEPQAEPQQESHEDSGIDSELLRLSGPPRFLFTIREETKEDLESEGGKSRRRRRSLSDVLLHQEESTPPFFTPTNTSPSYFTPPLSPLNPFLESTTDFEFNSFAGRPSPPPTFKFMRDAEEKLYRRRILEEMEEAQRLVKKKDAFIQVDDCGGDTEISSTSSPSFSGRDDEANGSFVRLIICPLNREEEHENLRNVSQVVPLASSPPPSLSPSNFTSIHTRSSTR
ncbi:unnamed protein product [Cuscuta epithymum]|uniref:Uncharacterized protein n=1 Tax=Cuscuta epithymum TaxID=186058 RepID=A0AAV0FZF9_9ASTE|nr:unnamed protein product [Cuscuta epithymum]CAH9140752.1 unnamed protein product [Cuscuta epithymum]